jgi:hypothetical protein
MSKNIVLLSDGTGQRGGVGYETNVWRLYQALKSDNDRQLLCYDDGVGSQRSRVSKILGGVSAVGLDQNVHELYAFLVRHWEAGDRIYMFGFSRGAFTVRLLSDMVARCGLLDLHRIHSEQELSRLIKAAYTSCLRSYYSPAFARRFKEKFSRVAVDGEVDIHFIGVWDTVGAIGLPFKEVHYAMHNWMRYGFRGLALNQNIKHACQAFSIDDCRETFHPVVWDERLEESGDRIVQVWFAGVHSNVGGGYPKRQLAVVVLDWMIQQVKEWDARCPEFPENQLQFSQLELEKIAQEKNVHSHLYNSRSGFATLFRFLPRNMESIRQTYTEGDIKVHQSVFARIKLVSDFYSPHNLTEHCDSPHLKDEEGESLVTDTWRESMSVAWSYSFLQKVIYSFILVLFILLLIMLGRTVKDLFQDQVLTWRNYLPLIIVSVILGASTYVQSRLSNRQASIASAGWASIFQQGRVSDNTLVERAKRSRIVKIAEAIRTSWFVDTLAHLKIFIIYALVYFPGCIYRFLVHVYVRNRFQGINISTSGLDDLLELTPGKPHKFIFETNMFKMNTGLRLHKGRRYTIQVDAYSGWFDKDFPADPTGLLNEENLPRSMKIARKIARLPGEKMFALLVEVGGNDVFKVGMGTTFTCTQEGELALYVNDASPRIRFWGKGSRVFQDIFYFNNRGTARISVEAI